MIGRRPIRIEGLRLERNEERDRVAAEVNGATLYFESRDAELRPTPEAFVSALLVPALTRGADLVLADALDPAFLDGVTQLMQTFRGWWGYRKLVIRSSTTARVPATAVARSNKEKTGTALCFSGGVDSFFSLLCNEEQIDALVFVHGFDIDLADTERANTFQSSLLHIAEHASTRPLVLKTNLREHPVYQGVNWDHAHGGALAAVGHLLANSNRLIIAASYPSAYPNPSGSRWDLDPLWSSTGMQISHHGEAFWRGEKLRKIAALPIVREHLRVCWEHRGGGINCSRCEKCVRTMLTLKQAGALETFPVFDSAGGLADRVKGLGHISPILQPVYRAFLETDIDSKTNRALLELIAAKAPPPKKLTRAKTIRKRFKNAFAR